MTDTHLTIPIRDYTENQHAFARGSAERFRVDVDAALTRRAAITFDLRDVRGLSVGFADEMIGRLILRHGPDMLSGINFTNCSEFVRMILTYVATDRSQQYQQTHQALADWTGDGPAVLH